MGVRIEVLLDLQKQTCKSENSAPGKRRRRHPGRPPRQSRPHRAGTPPSVDLQTCMASSSVSLNMSNGDHSGIEAVQPEHPAVAQPSCTEHNHRGCMRSASTTPCSEQTATTSEQFHPTPLPFTWSYPALVLAQTTGPVLTAQRRTAGSRGRARRRGWRRRAGR